jgi:hypothetical protein
MVRRQARDEEDAQRQAISKAKQRAAAELAKKAETLRRLRSLAAAHAAAQRSAAAAAAAEALEATGRMRERNAQALAQKKVAKREVIEAEKARLAADEKQTRFWQQQAKSGAAEVCWALNFFCYWVFCLLFIGL